MQQLNFSLDEFAADQAPIVILFPGQGAQYTGMGQLFADDQQTQAAFTSFYQQNAHKLPFNLRSLVLEGPDEKLQQTAFTQPAIVAHSLWLWHWLSELSPLAAIIQKRPKIFLGHSVGEYCALSAAGSFSAEFAISAVHERGQYMQRAVPMGVGTMSAILKADIAIIEQVCQQITTEQSFGVVTAANFNTREQIVISGNVAAVEEAEKRIKELSTGARCMRLKVSAPFHSPLMGPAQQEMAKYLQQQQNAMHPNQFPYIANVHAQIVRPQTDPADIRQLLVDQLGSSVLWCESLEKLTSQQSRCKFIECGPGKVLSGMVKKILPDAPIMTLDGLAPSDLAAQLADFLK